VREGLYHFTVTAEGYEAAWKNPKVKWGQDVPLEFTLTPIPILIKKIESPVLGLNELNAGHSKFGWMEPLRSRCSVQSEAGRNLRV